MALRLSEEEFKAYKRRQKQPLSPVRYETVKERVGDMIDNDKRLEETEKKLKELEKRIDWLTENWHKILNKLSIDDKTTHHDAI